MEYIAVSFILGVEKEITAFANALLLVDAGRLFVEDQTGLARQVRMFIVVSNYTIC